MQTRLLANWGSDSEEFDDLESPRVVIAYDDVPAGKQAVQVLRNVFQQCQETPELHPMVWKFDFLEDPEWSSLALGDAVKADILVIATSSDLSITVQQWIESYCAKKTGTSSALVALLGSAATRRQGDRVEFLERVARTAGIDFFAPENLSDNLRDMPQPDLAYQRNTNPFTPINCSARLNPYQHWGINE